ncbi:hypothetical protein MMC17_000068 [Xylographa soralifera]|nr:hypothetical protein [Xylographa soralifera]
MAPSTDLKEYATSTTDFYALLSLPPTFSAHELNRAWRRTALKYHPDKVGASDAAAAEKFHLAQIGFDIFQDPTIKTLYDNARNAREQKERARKMFEGERKRMREELEGREGRAGFRKGVGGEVGMKRAREEEDFERELRRLAEDGKRRRQEREEVLRQDLRAEQEAAANGTEGPQTPRKATTSSSAPQPPVATPVAELDRSVKVRWLPSSTSSASIIDKDTLATLFSRFGKVESAFLMKIKTQRTGSSREKKQVATGVVVFASVVGAHAAIEDTKKQVGPEWECVESVGWAGNKEPDFVAEMRGSVSPAPQTPIQKGAGDFLNGGTPAGGTPMSARTAGKSNGNGTPNGDGLRKVPSFVSFSSAAFSTPQGSPLGKVGSPSLEEITMIRLKEAEKRRLEAEIAKEDEKADLGL